MFHFITSNMDEFNDLAKMSSFLVSKCLVLSKTEGLVKSWIFMKL